VKATSVAEKSKAGAFSVPPLYRKVALPSSEFCPAHSLDISRQLSQPSQNLIIRDQWLAAKNSNQRAHHGPQRIFSATHLFHLIYSTM
jgi:hypothetical protein